MIKAINYLTEKYNYFNNKFFNNSITLPIKFEIFSGIDEGMTDKLIENKKSIIRIQINEILLELQFEEELENTLVHEMIHAWQIQYLNDYNHGRTFKTWAKKIKEIDPNMIIARMANPEEAKKFCDEIKKSAVGYLLIDKITKKGFFIKKLSNRKIQQLLNLYEIYYSSYIGFTPQYSTLHKNNLIAYYYEPNELIETLNNQQLIKY